MQKQTLLALAISFGILGLWSYLFPPPPPVPPPPAAKKAIEAPSTQKGLVSDISSGTTESESTTRHSAPPATKPVAVVGNNLVAEDLSVDTHNYHLVVNSRGGVLTNMQLNHYQHTKPRFTLSTWLPFLTSVLGQNFQRSEVEGNLVQMASNRLDTVQNLHVVFEGLDPTLFQNAVFSSNTKSIDLRDGKEIGTLILTSPIVNGLQIIKTFVFHPDSYVMDYAVQVINRTSSARTLKIRHVFGEGRLINTSIRQMSHEGPVYFFDDSVETELSKNVEQELQVGKADWFGLEDSYFLNAVAAETPIKYAYFQAFPYFAADNTRHLAPTFGARLPMVELQANRQIETKFQLYYGPKENSELAKFGRSLPMAHAMRLPFLANPTLELLRWIYSYTLNYGVAIILLTVLVRLLLFPLTYKGMKSMKRMQQLSPRMKKLQERYKKDKNKLNLEVMQLYRKNKVNPLGGCLPMVLQIPVFFALYSALSSAVELRHAPFIWWLSDLSAPDGLGITPFLMGTTMLVQQSLAPTPTTDPMQAKLMKMLPIIFTIFTFTFPSGLTLYWVTSNILSIGQQFIINRIETPEIED